MCPKVGRWLKKLYNIYIPSSTLLPGKRMELLWHGTMSEIYFLVKKQQVVQRHVKYVVSFLKQC